MDNPFPLESLNQRGDDPSDDEEEEVWDIKANTLTKSEVFGTGLPILASTDGLSPAIR